MGNIFVMTGAQELYDAAAIDGASEMRIFTSIALAAR